IVLPRRESSSGGPGPDDRDHMPPPPPPPFWTNSAANGSNLAAGMFGTNGPGRPDRPPRGRPFWMSEQEYKDLLERRGLHGLAIAMSTDAFRHTCRQDIWMRCVIGCFAGVSVIGFGLAWRNIAKSSDLQLRLLRASEMNTHLKEMNLAAAGLAHE